jgi:uncharacterized protein (TIGR00661 family)
LKKIVYYVTDHGLGHATRTVALIRKLECFNFKFILRTSQNEPFFKKSLKNIEIYSGKTDVGPIINNDGISINKKKSKAKIENWIEDIPKIAKKELSFLKKIDPDLVISDISAMPFLATNTLKIPSVAISNFSWYDVLKFISKRHLNLLKTFYDNADYALKLPFGTPMDHFKNKVNCSLLVRNNTLSKIKLRKELGFSKQDFLITIALGNHKKLFKLNFDDDHKIISFDKNIQTKNKLLYLENWIEGQNIISLSNLVICKCGYGLISECIANKIPFYYVSDQNHLEQKAMNDELILKSIGQKISLKNLEFNSLSIKDISNYNNQYREKIDDKKIINFISELIN